MTHQKTLFEKLQAYAAFLDKEINTEGTYEPESRGFARGISVAYNASRTALYKFVPELKPVSDFELGVRARKLMGKANVKRICDLLNFSEEELRKIPLDEHPSVGRAGTTTLKEIRETLLTPFGFDYRSSGIASYSETGGLVPLTSEEARNLLKK